MEELKLHWSPENYNKTIKSYDEKISKLKKEKGNIVAEYIKQNAFVPTQRDRNVWIEVEKEYVDPVDGKVVVEALHNMVLGYYAVQKGTRPFFKENTVAPILYPNYFIGDKSRQFGLNNYADRNTIEIRYREKGSDTYYYSRGGNFEEMKMYDADSKWHGGKNDKIKYIEMHINLWGCACELENENVD